MDCTVLDRRSRNAFTDGEVAGRRASRRDTAFGTFILPFRRIALGRDAAAV
jgi:hypothetical protein